MYTGEAFFQIHNSVQSASYIRWSKQNFLFQYCAQQRDLNLKPDCIIINTSSAYLKLTSWLPIISLGHNTNSYFLSKAIYDPIHGAIDEEEEEEDPTHAKNIFVNILKKKSLPFLECTIYHPK